MNGMNRRDFVTLIGGASAVALGGIRPLFAATNATATTPLYLDGLVMLSFEDKKVLRIGFPKAPGHKATLQIVPVNGVQRSMAIKGNGTLETKVALSSQPKINVPELVRINELYGDDVHSTIQNCPSVISIPYSAIQSISTYKTTPDRWTFVRTDTGEEIESFRPRQLAESLKIELLSSSVLKFAEGKTSIPLEATRELRSRYAPEAAGRYPDMYTDHFVHYFEYIERPPAADYLVAPKKVSGAPVTTTPKIGNRFMWIDGDPMCYMVVIGLSL